MIAGIPESLVAGEASQDDLAVARWLGYRRRAHVILARLRGRADWWQPSEWGVRTDAK
jgi:hypothetical protein